MSDVGEKDRPPGDPPDAHVSSAKKVAGSNTGGMLTPEVVLDDDFVTERVSLDFLNGKDGEPVITIGKEVLDAINGL